MFCPKCRYEYVEGATNCPECNVPLVDKLPPEPGQEPVKLISVLATDDPGVVAVAKSILDGAGVQYLAKGEMLRGTVGSYGGIVTDLGPIEIQVAEEDEEAARKLLEDM